MATHRFETMLSCSTATPGRGQNVGNNDVAQVTAEMPATTIPSERRREVRRAYRKVCSYEVLEAIGEESVVIRQGEVFALNRSREGILILMGQAPAGGIAWQSVPDWVSSDIWSPGSICGSTDCGMKLPVAAYSAEVATSATKAGSCGVSCGILRSHYPPSPRLRRVLSAFIPVAAYSAEVTTSATKAGSYGVLGAGE